jgi:hypothetical protein
MASRDISFRRHPHDLVSPFTIRCRAVKTMFPHSHRHFQIGRPPPPDRRILMTPKQTIGVNRESLCGTGGFDLLCGMIISRPLLQTTARHLAPHPAECTGLRFA